MPLTHRHTLGLVGAWEDEGRGRIGVEVYHTGRQTLEDNPYRNTSRPHWILELLAGGAGHQRRRLAVVLSAQAGT